MREKEIEQGTYRVRYKFKAWVGKPDPSGFGTGHVYSDRLPWIHEKAAELHREGHSAIKIQKWSGSKYKTI